MINKINKRGFSLVEVLVATAIFLLFALGIYGTIHLVFKIVYQSRMRILETALLAEQLEVARNLPYDSIGIINGVPSGVLPHATSTVRNGVKFNIITTVRNIDDPFDGTASGNPRDTAPADYKLVEISAICDSCSQAEPVILNTMVAPKHLEGASNNGSLFIQVFDANGLPVAGADVDVTNTARLPYVVINDTTDNEGMLRVIDTPTGTLSYHIRVSKPGYSSDYTVVSSPNIPNPLHPPANVVSQTVTDISFSIDRVANLNLSAINPSCVAVGNVPFSIWGQKVLARNPDVFKYSGSFITNGNGNYGLPNLEWDKYNISVSGTAYDVAGSIPMLPFDLTPGLTQNTFLILRPRTSNSLLVQVKDSGTGLPLSNASVHLTNPPNYDSALITGVGYMRQTDWSGGSGQSMLIDETKYFSDNSNIDTDSPAGDVKLKKVGNNYLNSGWLESSTFDLATAVNFNNIIFIPLSQPPQTGSDPITFLIAASDTSTPPQWDFVGPDGTANTYYTATNTLIYSGHNGSRYLRYKVFLNTANTSYTPQLSEVAFTYTNSCTPPGQSFFNNFSAGSYTLEVSRDGYNTSSGVIDINGTEQMIVNLSPSF